MRKQMTVTVHVYDVISISICKAVTSRAYLIDGCGDDGPERTEDEPDGWRDEGEADEVNVVVDGVQHARQEKP